MVDLRTYFSESNAIEDVHTESAVEKTMEAWEYLQSANELTHTTLQTAHEKILEDRQPEIAGAYRDVQVTVGERVAPPPVVVESEMDKLLAWTPSDPLEAIEWHVAFERIHPFADGNGRIGRLVYCWHCRNLGAEPVVWRAEDREGYYDLFEREVDLDGKSPLVD
jgi:Fic family protein